MFDIELKYFKKIIELRSGRVKTKAGWSNLVLIYPTGQKWQFSKIICNFRIP